MSACLLCASDLLLHINSNQLYWYCDRCRETFSLNLLKHYPSLSEQPLKTPRYRRSPHNPIRSHSPQPTLECLYRNDTLHPQIIRISNLANTHWERTVLPGKCVTFQTVPTAILEVIAGPATMMVADRIPCRSLSVKSHRPTQALILRHSQDATAPSATESTALSRSSEKFHREIEQLNP